MKFNIEELMKIADQASMNSKDQSTKVGVAFFNKRTGFPIGYGYNGMPRGLNDIDSERNARPEKYKWIEHAERNGIYNLARATLSDKRVLTLMLPNMEDARAVVSCGIKEVICYADFALINKTPVSVDDSPSREWNRVKTLFKECDIKLHVIDPENVNKEDEKLNEHLKILRQCAKAQSTGNVVNAATIYETGTTTPIPNGFGVSETFKIDGDLLDENGNKLSYPKDDLQLEPIKAAIFNHVKPILENSLAVPTWCPCIRCSIAMVKSGVEDILSRQIDLNDEADKRWESSFGLSKAFLKKVGVNLELRKIPKVTAEEFKTKILDSDKVALKFEGLDRTVFQEPEVENKKQLKL